MERIGVVGLGLIGGSIAAALKASGCRVVGFDVNPSTSKQAHQLGLIDDRTSSLAAATSSSDVVVVAVPIHVVSDVLKEISAVAQNHATVLDTASVKEPVVATMERLPSPGRFVGGHPMAGTEGTGPASARPDLFRQRSFALVPTSQTSDGTMRIARALVEKLGAYPLLIEAALHDHIVARTSHLPYLAAIALALACDVEDGRLVGPALQDMLRLASSDIHMWHDIAAQNREPMLSALIHYRRKLDEVVRAMDDGRWDEFDSLLLGGRDRAREIRSTLS